ncbi:uncharacterized protein LOC8068402 isoform X2 [Sorghum bicolor]|nr:uncharacterized protein LOC8068402 isoform X2 [Sorghum bicolor]|eukprot:XP_021304594.1 uncharacterized protein LOC8068402 isoform X2 [Sorghum bicolor]
MIRALVSLMKTVDSKPEIKERTVLVKLLYYDDVTPEDYEPPYAENEAINIWNKNPLKIEVGNVNSKHFVLALKVKEDLHPCDDNNTKSGWDEMRFDNDFDTDGDGDFSDTQVQLSRRRFGYVLCTKPKNFKFILDSGATHHICNDEAIMRNLREVKKEDRLSVYSSGGKELSAERMGYIDLKNFSLNPVGLIPSMQFNVVSVGQLAKQGLMICCGNGQFSVYDMREGRIVGEGYLDNKLNEYVFRTLKWLPQAENLVEIPKNDTQKVNDEQQAQNVWLIDTGCAQHLVSDVTLLTNVRNDKRPFETAKGTIWSSHRGKFKAGKLVLNDVLYCKSVQDNLMSGPLLDKAGYRITFCGKTCTLVHKDGLEQRGVAIQDVSNNLYSLEEEEQKDNSISAQGDAKEAKRRRLE